MKVWAMPVARPYMLERPPRRRADPGRLRQGRRHGRDRLLRMGRVSRALARPRTATARCILGWTGDNGDPDNFLAHAARLRRRRRQQPRAVVQRGVRRAGHRRPRRPPTRPSAPSSTKQAQVVFKREAPWATLAHSLVVMPMSKKVSGFVMNPLGTSPLRRRRHRRISRILNDAGALVMRAPLRASVLSCRSLGTLTKGPTCSGSFSGGLPS